MRPEPIFVLHYSSGSGRTVVPISAPPPGRQGPRDARDHRDHARTGPASDIADARLVWIGADDRGIELEIVALDLEDAVVVIHVMPPA